MKQFKSFLILVIIGILIVFAIQNFENVTIKFFKWGMTLPLALTTIIVYVLGMFTGGLLWSNLKKLANHDK